MKNTNALKEILKGGSPLSTDEQAIQIIALAVPRKGAMKFDEADEPGDKLVALRELTAEIAKLDENEVTIRPALFALMMSEMENRSSAFTSVSTRLVVEGSHRGQIDGHGQA
jgi:hypothetical protein